MAPGSRPRASDTAGMQWHTARATQDSSRVPSESGNAATSPDTRGPSGGWVSALSLEPASSPQTQMESAPGDTKFDPDEFLVCCFFLFFSCFFC